MSNSNPQPLSPHLQIYRPQITSMLSILHRMTGFGLAFGAILFTWWLLAIALGGDHYATFQHFAFSFVGKIMLFMWLYAFVYHFMNGVRHLIWDTGRGITIKSATLSGWFIFIGSIALSIIIWFQAG